jgi:hypothetical protein
VWDNLDTCFNRSEKYIVEALDPLFRGTDCTSMLLLGSLLTTKVNHDGSKECSLPEKADKRADLTRNNESDAPCRLEVGSQGEALLEARGHGGLVLGVLWTRNERIP